jgi:4-hydroxybenzoate polyprenyltransferase
MQVQDLKDQAGDRHRRRKTIPLVLGDGASRWIIASCMPIWSLVCSYYWELRPWSYALPVMMGFVVAFRAIQKREPREDARTWRYWCLWTAFLYFLPVMHRVQLKIAGDHLRV